MRNMKKVKELWRKIYKKYEETKEIWRKLRKYEESWMRVKKLRKIEKSWAVRLDCSLIQMYQAGANSECNWWEVDWKVWSIWNLRVVLIVKKEFEHTSVCQSTLSIRLSQDKFKSSSSDTKNSPLDPLMLYHCIHFSTISVLDWHTRFVG